MGARVVAVDRDRASLDGLGSEAEGPAGLETFQGDLADPQGCRRAVERARSRLGGLDVFVHAVGINDRRPVLETPDEVWERILTTNLSS